MCELKCDEPYAPTGHPVCRDAEWSVERCHPVPFKINSGTCSYIGDCVRPDHGGLWGNCNITVMQPSLLDLNSFAGSRHPRTEGKGRRESRSCIVPRNGMVCALLVVPKVSWYTLSLPSQSRGFVVGCGGWAFVGLFMSPSSRFVAEILVRTMYLRGPPTYAPLKNISRHSKIYHGIIHHELVSTLGYQE